jgi:hypothetical protein
MQSSLLSPLKQILSNEVIIYVVGIFITFHSQNADDLE